MLRIITIITIAICSSSANADTFAKEVELGLNNYIFRAQTENMVDQFGKNVVEFTNPTVNGMPIFISTTNLIVLKTKLCNALGFEYADGYGAASLPEKFVVDLDKEKSLIAKPESTTTTDMFRCLGSI
jgi:hypothetical protein